jgi:hypothetical protein
MTEDQFQSLPFLRAQHAGKFLIAGVLALSCCGLVSAQGRGGGPGVPLAAPAPVPRDAAGHPDLSGYWELHYDSRSVSPASLTKEAIAKMSGQEQHDRLAMRWCALVGMPEVMEDGSTLDLRQGSKDIAILAKTTSSVRYIYLDGRSHPAKDELDPVTNGNSVAQWDGETLVVDTIGFSDRGITAIPGGGFRTLDSHLVERFRLLSGGRVLSVISTWADSKVFAKPHSYEFRYSKAMQNSLPLQYQCNANDQDRANFLMPDAKAVAGR